MHGPRETYSTGCPICIFYKGYYCINMDRTSSTYSINNVQSEIEVQAFNVDSSEDPAHLLFYFFTRFDKIMNVGTFHNGPDRIGSGLMADQLIIKRSISVS